MFDRLYPGMPWGSYRDRWPLAEASRFVVAGGRTWHVQISGQGPCLLLLHGTGSGSFSWRGLIPILSRYFRVVAPDLPGHVFTTRGATDGLSLNGMSDGLCALIRQLNLQPSVLVGHSAGAAIAANMVLRDDTLSTAHLIGMNPAWLPLPGLSTWLFGPAAKLAAINPLSAWATAKLAKRPSFLAKSLAQTGSVLSEEGMALYQTVFSHSGHVHSVLGMMAAWQLAPLSDALARIKNPVSIFVGLNDQTIPPALAEQACKVMPQAVLHQQPQLGHLAHEERPEASAKAVLSACGVI